MFGELLVGNYSVVLYLVVTVLRGAGQYEGEMLWEGAGSRRFNKPRVGQ